MASIKLFLLLVTVLRFLTSSTNSLDNNARNFLGVAPPRLAAECPIPLLNPVIWKGSQVCEMNMLGRQKVC